MMKMLSQVEKDLLRDELNREKESEFRQIIKYKDEEMKILRKTLLEEKMYEVHNLNDEIRILREEIKHSRVRDLEMEIESLKTNNEKCNELIKKNITLINKKDEIINKMKLDHERELNKVLREARREHSKSISELQQIKKSLNESNCTKDAKNDASVIKNNNCASCEKLQKVEHQKLTLNSIKGEEEFKHLINRNVELESLVQTLEEQIEQLRCNWNDALKKVLLEKSQEESKVIANIKKTFAIQRARDLADHARVIMLKDKENKLYQSIIEEKDKQHKVFLENNEALQFAEKERLRLEKQLLQSSLIEEQLQLDVHRLTETNSSMANELENLQKIHSECLLLKNELDQVNKELIKTKELLHNENKNVIKLEKILLNMKNLEMKKEDKELQCNFLVSYDTSYNFKENTINVLSYQSKEVYTQYELPSSLSSSENFSDIKETSVNSSPKHNFDTSIESMNDFNVFVSSYTYDPSVYSRNEDFDMELPLNKGDKVYVYGGMNEDGFYLGELKSGERGLVPSNFIEKFDDDFLNMHTNEKKSPSQNKIVDNEPLSEEYLMKSFHSPAVTNEFEDDLKSFHSPAVTKEIKEKFSNSAPINVHIKRHLDKCMIVAWSPPLDIKDMTIIKGYTIYVNGVFNQTVLGALRTKALISDVDSKFCSVSVSTLMIDGEISDPLVATVSFGNEDVSKEKSCKHTSDIQASFVDILSENQNNVTNFIKELASKSFMLTDDKDVFLKNNTFSGEVSENNNSIIKEDKFIDRNEHSDCTTLHSDSILDENIIENEERLVISCNELSTIEEENESISSVRSTDSFSLDDKLLEVSFVKNIEKSFFAEKSKLAKNDYSFPQFPECKSYDEIKQTTFLDENHNNSFSLDSVIYSDEKNEMLKDLIDDYPELPLDNFDKLQNVTFTKQSSQVHLNKLIGEKVLNELIGEKVVDNNSLLLSPTFTFDKKNHLSSKLPSEKRPHSARRSLDFNDEVINEYYSKSTLEEKNNNIDKIKSNFWESPSASPSDTLLIKPPPVTMYSFGMIDSSGSPSLSKEPNQKDEQGEYSSTSLPYNYKAASVKTNNSHQSHQSISNSHQSHQSINNSHQSHQSINNSHQSHQSINNSHQSHQSINNSHQSINNLDDKKLNNNTENIILNNFTESINSNKLTPNENVFEEKVRVFVALYNYDPITMSPNIDYASEELGFEEGDLIQIYGSMDEDGFYLGELKNVKGLVPSNMVKEVSNGTNKNNSKNVNQEKKNVNQETKNINLEKNNVNQETKNTNQEKKNVNQETKNINLEKKNVKEHTQIDAKDNLFASKSVTDLSQGYVVNSKSATDLSQGYVVNSKSVTDLSQGYVVNRLSASMPTQLDNLNQKIMITIYSYDPNMSSPNVDSEVELSFQANEVAYIFGEMDEDGFYNGSINGRYGLIPSNFVREATENELSKLNVDSPKIKKKNSIFKKSKKIFSRLKRK
ncbi:reticulocyte-binding protein homolog 1 isoform X2 [Hydra vulgaris]|uniref:Reticulocyte-binding protein homolog 1 isoform X2 n=1 Tax=Hydra vulgaris TaxID=6087 RepID=A0ABM4CP47_HYDVU